MKIIRNLILVVSFSLTVFFVFFGVIRGSHLDFLLLLTIIFFSVNTFYAFYSKPTFVLSETFGRAATGLALATLEMKHQAEEAKSRELEAIRSKVSHEENNVYKLKAARDFMEFAADNPYLRKHYDFFGDSVASTSMPKNVMSPPAGAHQAQIEKIDRPTVSK